MTRAGRSLADACSGEIANRDDVSAAEGGDLDLLDAVEVHGDVADITEEPDAAAVGRDVHVLTDVRAVEQQCVDTILALDNVAAVARIPDERVVVAAEKSNIIAPPTDHSVVSVAGDEGVGA